MELFNLVMNREDKGVVEELAQRAATAWHAMCHDLQLGTGAVYDTLASMERPRNEVSNAGQAEYARL